MDWLKSLEFTFWYATKTVELRMKYINRTLVIVRVALYILRFVVIVELVQIDQNECQ